MSVLDANFTPSYQSSAAAAWSAFGNNNQLGFVSPYVLAFEQHANADAVVNSAKILADFRNLFKQVETVNDLLKKAVESKLTPNERYELSLQEREFRRRQLTSLNNRMNWGMTAPNLADYALIEKRDRMLRDAENEVCRQVRESMTLSQQRELNMQYLQYAEQMRSYTESPVLKLRPQPGPAVQEFYRNIKRAVARFGGQ
ncbi:MAG: hypothetical protein IT343_11680 [Candidatus Melainabacteria bacterium]|jgi:hypothetical protein|nr:hypothetical protein [Candidatus Melainabacteria bacterium]